MEFSLKSYEEYFAQSTETRMIHYQKNGRLKHVMLSQQFSIQLLEELFDIADRVKEMTRKTNGIEFLKSLLCHKKAMLYFINHLREHFFLF